MKGDTGQNLIGLLEQRLDMIVYRAKFAPDGVCRAPAGQPRPYPVNGVKSNVASRRCFIGDEITLGAKAKEMALVMEAQSLAEREIPDYVAPGRQCQGDLHPRTDARRSAVSGEDGAESGGRILQPLMREFSAS